MKPKLLSFFATLFVLAVISTSLLSCKKFLELEAPVTSTNSDIVYSSDASATAVLTGIYTRISQTGINNGIMGMSVYPSLSSDELQLFDEVTDITWQGYAQNELQSTTTGTTDFWNSTYPIIYVVNSAIEGITASAKLSPLVQKQLLGEAYFIRAFCYFTLVNLYGDVPLILSADYNENSKKSRTDKSDVYKQIVNDLILSESQLSDNYVDLSLKSPTSERIIPNKWAAKALLARAYLYTGRYQEAEESASAVIGQQNLYDTVAVNEVFKKNSKETIWSLQPVDNFVSNTPDAMLFILPADGPNTYQNQVYLTNSLCSAFEVGDKRKQQWVDSVITSQGRKYRFSKKYSNNILFSPVSEYNVVFRLAELFLIRAEARALQGNLSGASTDLNLIRKRAGLSPFFSTNQPEMVKKIVAERRVEFFLEWGHRWLDLKRTGNASSVLSSLKENWEDTDVLYPIPQNDIDRNPSLKNAQNAGYN